MLGSVEDVPYRPQTCQLQPGDTVYIYTDGVPESNSAKGEFYGEERLEKALNSSSGLDPVALCLKIKEDLEAFAEGAEQFDDITMLALRYNGIAN